MHKSCPKPLLSLDSLLPIVIAIISYSLVIGYRALNPTNIAWLALGDLSSNYLGWAFFRHSPWTFPIGLNPNFGIELSSSILFSDSNPLLAFLFKFLSPWLPPVFQYCGIWLLSCFILQSWFSWKILTFITSSLTIRALGTTLLLFMPPLLFRVSAHINLVSHFLIIIALYLYINPHVKKRKTLWGTLLATAALVHSYFLPMIAVIWLANLSTNVIRRQLAIKSILFELVTVILLLVLTCWQTAYFCIGTGVASGGYGFYRMNILSPLNPMGFSYILKDFPVWGAGDYEGFSYFGLGVIILIFCALPAILMGKFRWLQLCKKHSIFIIMLVALAIFAISNNIGIGPYNFSYPLPNLINRLFNIFRASGRMFWPIFYTIIFTVIYMIIRGYKKRIAIYLLALAVIVQIVDTYAFWGPIRKDLLMGKPSTEWNTSLTDPFWKIAATKYTKVRWLPPMNANPHWSTIAYYALTHGLETDSIYLARIDDSALQQLSNKSKTAINSGNYAADTLYILDPQDKNTAQIILRNLNSELDLFAKINHLLVLAPGWKKYNPSLSKDELTLLNIAR